MFDRINNKNYTCIFNFVMAVLIKTIPFHPVQLNFSLGNIHLLLLFDLLYAFLYLLSFKNYISENKLLLLYFIILFNLIWNIQP